MVVLVAREDLFPDPHIASFGDRHARAVGHPDHLKCSQLQMPPLNGSRSLAVGPNECAALMRRDVFDKNFAYVRLVSSVASARLAGAAHARCPNARSGWFSQTQPMPKQMGQFLSMGLGGAFV